jgi:uncharacterized protein
MDWGIFDNNSTFAWCMKRASVLISTAVASAAAAQPTPDDQACAMNDADACFRLATVAVKANDEVTAARWYASACNAGNGLACVYMGTSYETVDANKPRWLEKVRPALEKRCKAGEAEHCYYLGIAFERGTGAPVDGKQSLAAYQRACDLDFVLACTNLAGNYRNGTGTAADPVKAAELYTRACRRGDDLACYWLGSIYDGELQLVGDRERLDHVLLGSESSTVFDLKRHQGKTIAALIKGADSKALRRACDAKTGLACYLLGVITLATSGAVAKADAAAAELHRRACDNGNGWGCFTLGDMYVRGFGVARSFADAAHYYAQVCVNGVGGEANSFVGECQALADGIALSAVAAGSVSP